MEGPIDKGMSWLRSFIEANRRCSRWQSQAVNRLTGRRVGREDFCRRILPNLLRPGLRVLDVGGGKQPVIDSREKRRWGLSVTGLDTSRHELSQAPPGSFDRQIVADVASADLDGPYDLIVSRTVLEHVKDTRSAIANLASALSPGGAMAHFVPCRNAPFARISRALGHQLSRRALLAIYPDKHATQGYPAYYDLCSPRQLQALCAEHGLDQIEVTPYYQSEYFAFCAPLQCLELLRQTTCMALGASQWCETFAVVARRPGQRHRAARAA